MITNILAVAKALPDGELLARLDVLASKERSTMVELLAHLAALDSRSSLYAAQGFGSLFSYCREALRFSEDAACARIEAARACRRFPLILDLLASGAMGLTSVRLLARHLTPENHAAVLDRACGRSRREIEALVAELAPRPDVAASVRKLPTPRDVASSSSVAPPESGQAVPPSAALPATTVPSLRTEVTQPSPTGGPVAEPGPDLPATTPPRPLRPPARPIVQATSPQRYRVQFTIGEGTHQKLRRLQTLLRREIPDGDPAVIFDRALSLLLERVEARKLGARRRPSQAIRARTDSTGENVASENTPIASPSGRGCCSSRHIPQPVKRAVWERDGGQCSFVSAAGRRCSERTFLEYHHVLLYSRQGPATPENIWLHCRRHNQHEAELVFGPRKHRDQSLPEAPPS